MIFVKINKITKKKRKKKEMKTKKLTRIIYEYEKTIICWASEGQCK